MPDAAPLLARRALLLALGVAALPAARAQPQRWPAGPVHLMLAYPPGGISDEITRVLADKLAARLQVPVLVEHRPGAGGAVAMDRLSRAAPDGHLLCVSAVTALTLVPHVTPVRYDPLRDIVPVAGVMATPVLVVGTPALRARTFAEMLALARQRPGQLRWATSGVGTTGHRVLQGVRAAAGVDIAHIPYKGGGSQLNDALAGQFELLSTNVAPTQLQHVKTGRYTALAVGAPARLPVLPDVPTLAEVGASQANRMSLFGVFAPGGTPAAVVDKLNAEVRAALRHADVRARLQAANNEPVDLAADEIAALVAREWSENRSDATPDPKR
jgi:tripartite-type tricarboxylate transporter receptor subunit TctC